MGDRTRVLVASGDEGLRAQAQLTLGEERFDVHVAVDTESAVRAVALAVPDVLILDIELPGQGALAIARSLRSQPETASMPTLLLLPRGQMLPADTSGLDATLSTPTSSFTLLRKVDLLLEGA